MSSRIIQIKVKPRAKKSSLEQLADGTWVAQVRSPAIEGRANQELIGLVADHFKCPKAAVLIKTGAAGRVKLVRIEG